ncbi:MAG: hypothetical protein KIT48_13300 [Pseudolabrys sp.]|nr:hypothetical protein [Pseudolabrys sp.]
MTQQRQTAPRAALALTLLLALGMFAGSASDALADKTEAELKAELRRARGACQGAYPGWLRGIVDAYTGLVAGPVLDVSFVLKKVPTPEALKTPDERLGWGDGLQAGYKAGLDYGMELGKAARTPTFKIEAMNEASERLNAYTTAQCGAMIPELDWDTTMMNTNRTLTLTSLTLAYFAMERAANANEFAVGAENAARCAREAEAKGDQTGAQNCRAEARKLAESTVDFAEMAKGFAGQREEAVQAVVDAEAAVEKARKAADDAGG